MLVVLTATGQLLLLGGGEGTEIQEVVPGLKKMVRYNVTCGS